MSLLVPTYNNVVYGPALACSSWQFFFFPTLFLIMALSTGGHFSDSYLYLVHTPRSRGCFLHLPLLFFPLDVCGMPFLSSVEID